MPRSPNRLVHGMGNPRLPSQAVVAGGGATPAQKLTPTGIVKPQQGPGVAAAPARRQIVPVSIIDAFYQMLPAPNIQQQAISKENNFSAADLNDGLLIGEVVTRQQQVYIWTDIKFYAIVPGPGMASPPIQLESRQLSGLIRFDVQIDNISPMNLIAATESPYVDPSFPTQGNLAGWQTLESNFGSMRYGSAFALYARSQQTTRIVMKAVQRDRYPRFTITKIGFEMHGYVAPEADFDEIWRRTIGR